MPPLIKFAIQHKAVVFVAIASAAYAIGLAVWAYHANVFAMDFAAYWRAAHQSVAEAYAPRKSLPFPYPPTMFLWIAPLAVVPSFWLAYFAFAGASLVAFAAASRRYLSRRQVVLAIISPPIVNGLSVGQCSIVLAAALLSACGMSNRLHAGIALGLIASVKPQLVLMAPVLFLTRRDWMAFAGAAAAWSTAVLASLAIYRPEAWLTWLASLSTFHSILTGKDRFGMALSPAMAAEFAHLPPLPFMIAGLAVGIWLIWIARHSDPLTQCAAIACASLLAVPYAMLYDLAAIIPFLVVEVWVGSIVLAIAMIGVLAPIALPLTGWGLANTVRRSSDDVRAD